jgi:hypothetical protein
MSIYLRRGLIVLVLRVQAIALNNRLAVFLAAGKVLLFKAKNLMVAL